MLIYSVCLYATFSGHFLQTVGNLSQIQKQSKTKVWKRKPDGLQGNKAGNTLRGNTERSEPREERT